ncbi:hypothetical protein [Streptomyces celluloflavus]|uniref:hypothetical protein n=1 Tax=Streptomyces celluloflavus TaxID=58344 RepID=UPI0034614D77|nr:hypothetical protein OG717_29915 [Streptomyces celluloflavus]
MPHPTSTTIAERIEDLYGAPLAQLEAHVDTNPRGSMLAALLGSHADLQLAERTIDFQLQRLRQLADPEREIGPYDAGHLLDCARRIAESVAVRDAHSKNTSAVLESLHRVPARPAQPPTPAPPAVPIPAPASAAARPR